MHPKLWLIVAPAILVALAVSYTFSAQLTFWWLGLSVFLLILLSLQAVFVSNRKTAALFLALESMALASFLVIASPEGAWQSLVITLVLFLLFFYSHHLAQHRIKNNLKISFSELRRHALPTMSMTLVAFLIANYAVTLIQSDKPLEISREIIAIAARPLGPIIESVIANPGARQSFIISSDSEESPLVIASEAKQSLDLYRETLIDTAHQTINAMLTSENPAQRRSLILTAAVFIFFIASGGLYFVNYLVAFLAWAIFKLLLLVGFAKITTETIYKEKLLL